MRAGDDGSLQHWQLFGRELLATSALVACGLGGQRGTKSALVTAVAWALAIALGGALGGVMNPLMTLESLGDGNSTVALVAAWAGQFMGAALGAVPLALEWIQGHCLHEVGDGLWSAPVRGGEEVGRSTPLLEAEASEPDREAQRERWRSSRDVMCEFCVAPPIDKLAGQLERGPSLVQALGDAHSWLTHWRQCVMEAVATACACAWVRVLGDTPVGALAAPLAFGAAIAAFGSVSLNPARELGPRLVYGLLARRKPSALCIRAWTRHALLVNAATVLGAFASVWLEGALRACR